MGELEILFSGLLGEIGHVEASGLVESIAE
jgi:hypothetical protein